jgi:hypothetical protein
MCRLQHSKGLDFSATEAKTRTYDSSLDQLKDAFYKLPKTLKDMLDALIEAKPEFGGSLQNVGFVQSGFSSTMVQVDRPTEYITRVTRHKTVGVSHVIENFGGTILPSMLSAWICTEIVNQVFQIFISLAEEGEENFFWMRNYLEKRKGSPVPTTSRSNETSSRKKTKIAN